MNRPRVPRRNPKVVFRQLADGEGVLLHLDTGAYHGVNAAGAVIWELVDDDRDEGEIALLLAERFDDAPRDVEDLVAGYVDELVQRGLLQIATAE